MLIFLFESNLTQFSEFLINVWCQRSYNSEVFNCIKTNSKKIVTICPHRLHKNRFFDLRFIFFDDHNLLQCFVLKIPLTGPSSFSEWWKKWKPSSSSSSSSRAQMATVSWLREWEEALYFFSKIFWGFSSIGRHPVIRKEVWVKLNRRVLANFLDFRVGLLDPGSQLQWEWSSRFCSELSHW